MSFERAIVHVDLDAFFASVEQLDHPELRGKAVLVGGKGRRSVVCAASYEARRFGCHSAQPMRQALRHCPQAVVCTPRFARYLELSRRFFGCLAEFSPAVQELSIDEAFVDVSGSVRLLGPIEKRPAQIVDAVKAATGLDCSVGLASNMFLAKLASAHQKPRGITVIKSGQEQAFLSPLPVSRLWGVGKKTQVRLRGMGISTIGDLAQRPRTELIGVLGGSAAHLYELAHARDPRQVVAGTSRKQIGLERTFEQDLRGSPQVQRVFLGYATELADRLLGRSLRAGRVQIKLRQPDFKTITRQRRLLLPTFDGQELYRTAVDLFWASGWAEKPLRLLGLSLGELSLDAKAESCATPQSRSFPKHGPSEAGGASTVSNAPWERPAARQLELWKGAETSVSGGSGASETAASGAEDRDERARAEKRQRVLSEIRSRFGSRGVFPAKLIESATKR